MVNPYSLVNPIREVDGVSLKKCGNCKQEKPIAEFWTRATKTKGRAIKSECKTCLYKRRADWKVKNPERMYLLYRRNNIKNTYGISLETLELMREMQGDRCAICRDKFKQHYKRKHRRRTNLSIDHCHETGRVRGLLCEQCNVGLGSFRDNLDFLMAAYRYIKHHRELE